jgi:peptidoglycan hydrolase CwlO-like protein
MMSWRKHAFDREDEIKDLIKDFLYDLLEEASPLLPRETLKDLSEKKMDELYDILSTQLEEAQKEKSELQNEKDEIIKERDELMKDKESWEEEVEKLEDKVEKLNERIEELELRINNPSEFFGRKFNI